MLQAIIDRINEVTGMSYTLVKLDKGVLDLVSVKQETNYDKCFRALDVTYNVETHYSVGLYCNDLMLDEYHGVVKQYLTWEEQQTLVGILKESKDNDNTLNKENK